MKVILTKMCASLVGTLERGLGYHLEHRKSGFFAVRNNTYVPPDGHWRFIVLCAEMALNKLHITDIEVKGEEINEALREAGIRHKVLEPLLPKAVYNAPEILRLKEYYRL